MYPVFISIYSRNHVLSSSSDETTPIKRPELSPILSNTALRDLAVTEEYGVCVDARGDIYQWGDGFSGQLARSDRPPRPQKTLSGKVTRTIYMYCLVLNLILSGHIERRFDSQQSGRAVQKIGEDIYSVVETKSTRHSKALWFLEFKQTMDFKQHRSGLH